MAPQEANVNIHGNSLTLRGDGMSREVGAKFLDLFADKVYLYKLNTSKIHALRGIYGVRTVDLYPPSVKVHVTVRSTVKSTHTRGEAADTTTAGAPVGAPAAPSKSSTITVEIHFHRDVTDPQVQAAALNRIISEGLVEKDGAQPYEGMIVASAYLSKLEQIAAIEEVYLIENAPELEDYNYCLCEEVRYPSETETD
ncbi:hypothetical protein F4777DRAFT_601737 [Nemania sp. FL0916]|nr:hypothetical protein F4777DRAFT_601737 [Nemania sp. FL0916]